MHYFLIDGSSSFSTSKNETRDNFLILQQNETTWYLVIVHLIRVKYSVRILQTYHNKIKVHHKKGVHNLQADFIFPSVINARFDK